MATNRSRRLRKKLCVDEFQELGFELTLNFKADLSDQVIDGFIDQFLDDAIAGNGLDYVGGEDYGLVCLAKRGSVSEEQRAAVEAWLKGREELQGFEISPLLDVWYRVRRSTRLDRHPGAGVSGAFSQANPACCRILRSSTSSICPACMKRLA